MSRYLKKRTKSIGQPPGSLVHIGEITPEKTRITVIHYDEKNHTHRTDVPVEELEGYVDSNTVSWVNIDGVHDAGVIERVGETFGIHSLTLEDVMNTGQRPKTEDLGRHLFIVLKMLTYSK